MAKKTRWRWIAIILLIIMLVGGGGVFVYQLEKASSVRSSVVNVSARLHDWWSTRKTTLQANLEKAKQLAMKKADENPPIQFEFYETLPAMQMNVAANDASQKREQVTQTPSAKGGAVKHGASPIVKADELEKAFLSQLISSKYIVQLGVFRHKKSAKQLSESIQAAGYHAIIVTLRETSKEIYRVQLGPFLNKQEASALQRQLKQDGLKGIVKRIL